MKNLLTILLVFFGIVVKAQYVPNAGAYQYKGLKQTNSLQPPSTAGYPVTSINAPDSNYAALYYNKTDTTWYQFNPVSKTWSPFRTAGGVQIDSVFITSIDSIFITNTDSIFIISGNDTIYIGNSDQIRDTAKLTAGYGLIIVSPSTNDSVGFYGPNYDDRTVILDTSVLDDFISYVINNDTTIINNNDSVPAIIVDTLSNSPPAGATSGYKVLIGTSPTGLFAGHANDIAELVGAVWTFTDPVCNQQVIVDNARTYATYQYSCPANIWKQTSVLWRVGGNRGVGSNAFIGRPDKQRFIIKSWNKVGLIVDTTRDVLLPKYTGLENEPLFFKPGANGKIDTGRFKIPTYETPVNMDSVIYVDNGEFKYGTATGGDSYTASNGLTMSSNDVKLGGTLTGNTNIDLASHSLALYAGSFSINATSGGSATSVNFPPPTNPGYTKSISIDQPNQRILFTSSNTDLTHGGGITRPVFTAETRIFSDSINGSDAKVSIRTLASNKLEVNGAGLVKLNSYTTGNFYQNDTSLYKPMIVDASGNIYRSSWFGGGGSGWSLTGNAGLSSSFGGAVNYLGSSDDNDVVFKRNNIEIFRFYDDGESAHLYFTNNYGTGSNNYGILNDHTLAFGMPDDFSGVQMTASGGSGVQYANGVLKPEGLAFTSSSSYGSPNPRYFLFGTKLPGFTTEARDLHALDSAGTLIYNRTTGTPQWYDGSTWNEFGGGGSQDLQSVLTVGNTGSLDINITDGSDLKSLVSTNVMGVISDTKGSLSALSYQQDGINIGGVLGIRDLNSIYGVNVVSENLTNDRKVILPDADGTLAISASVNGGSKVYADTEGNIDLTVSSGGTTTNALTFNNSGSGDASPVTFNGSTAPTVSYNTIGAQAALSGTGYLKFSGTTPSYNATIPSSDLTDNSVIVKTNQANTYSSGNKQTFQSSATTAGMNFAGVSSDPSSLSNGDLWHNTTSNVLKYRANSTTRTIVNTDETQTLSNKSLTAPTITGNWSASRPLTTTGSTPSYSLGTGAGTGATASITGNDASGYVTINTGTTPTLGADIITITFNSALSNAPKSITWTAGNSSAAQIAQRFYVDQATSSSSAFVVKNPSTTAITASTTFIFYYYITK